MNPQTLLSELATVQYNVEAPSLTPMHQFEVDGRGVFRVDQRNGPSLLLRAYQDEHKRAAWLAERASVLLFLEAQGYPAPHVIPTRAGQLVGHYGGWSTLALAYIEGETVDDSLEDFRAIGARLGELHQIDLDQAMQVCPRIPHARGQPKSTVTDWIKGLLTVQARIPRELYGLYEFSLQTLQTIATWRDMPMAILHSDANAFNAVRTAGGEIVLIDWDGAGIGPAILDLGYLLVACHAFLPEWPDIVPHQGRIAAIAEGYSAVRTLTAAEMAALPAAIGFRDAFWAAESLPQMIGQDWRTHRGLRRFGGRYPRMSEIAAATSGYL